LVGFERPGGFAEYVTVRADELFTLPAVIHTDEQPLVEPLAVVRHAFRRAQLVPTDTVAVLGAGPIGLAAVAWAVAMGVSTVVVSEPSAPRRQLAARLGATSVLDPARDDVVAGVAEATDGGPSAVIECSGQPGLIEQGVEMAGVDGRIIVVGVCPQPDRFFPFWAMSKELDIRFSIYYGREDFTDTLDALVGRRLNALPMVTETVGLDALPERFARLVRDRDSGKVIVRP
jgi:(R,R)-butanediol dehydrogenase/meso-butanediol dehydrogenase/diacetyl reductase